MEHRGEILRDIIKESGMTQRAIARKLGVHHNTLANYFDQAELSLDVVLRVGELAGIDVSTRLPSLQRVVKPTEGPTPVALQEPNALYLTQTFTASVPESLPDCQKALMSLQAAHISLLHEHLNLVRKYQLSEVA
jgi:transcriptional regulator with XRE-family HTH domain